MTDIVTLREKKFHEYHVYINNCMGNDGTTSTSLDEQSQARIFYNNVASFEVFREVSQRTGMKLKCLPVELQLIYNLKNNLEYRRPAVRSLTDALSEDPVYSFICGFENYCMRPTSIVDDLREQNGLPKIHLKIYAPISFSAMTKAIALRRSMENANRYDDSDGLRVDSSKFTGFVAAVAQVATEMKKSLAHMVMNESNYMLVRGYTELSNRDEAFRLFREYLEDESTSSSND